MSIIMAEDRRHPLRPFEPGLIADFLQGKSLTTVELLRNGRSNTNYKITVDGAPYVLRLYSQGSPERESRVMRIAGPLVPVPIEIGRGDGWSLTAFVEGDSLDRVPEYSDVAAEMLAGLSSIEFVQPGWINADGTVWSFPFDGIAGFISQMLEREDVLVWTGPELAGAVLESIAEHRELVAELDSQRRLVHGDFNPTNILIKNGQVSGVLDWEYTHSGTPYMDIGNLLRHTDARYRPLIEQGLRAGGFDLPSDWLLRAHLVDLTSHLEFLTTARSDEFKRVCVERIKEFLRGMT